MQFLRQGLTSLFVCLLLSTTVWAQKPPSPPSLPSESATIPAAANGKLRLAVEAGVEDRFIVVLTDDAATDRRGRPFLTPQLLSSREHTIVDLSRSHAARVGHIWLRAVPGFSARMSVADARALAADPRVAFVEQVRTVALSPIYTLCTDPGVHTASLPPVFSGNQQIIDCANPVPGQDTCRDNWGLDRIDQTTVGAGNPPALSGTYRRPTVGAVIHAYPLDTGITPDHREFTGRLDEGVNVVVSALDPARTDIVDILGNSHGTHVAAILAGATYGVAKNARLHPVRITNNSGVATDHLLDGIEWILDNHPQDEAGVASLSVNGTGIQSSLALSLAVRRLLQAGIPMVESAGNNNRAVSMDSMIGGFYPREVIMVAASTRLDRRWFDQVDPCTTNLCGSNFGPEIDLFAPGAAILSASNELNDRACFLTGTSMAAPHVSGAAANLLALHPGASPGAVEKALVRVATLNQLDATTLNGSPNRLLFTVFPTSGTPVAGNDLYDTAVNKALVIPVAELLAGDIEWAGGPLTFLSASSPLQGTVSVAGGNVTFTPAAGFQGEARFTYTLRNAAGQQDSAFVWVQVGGLPLPPVAVDDFFTTAAGVALTFTATQLLANDSDPDGTFQFDDFVDRPAHGEIEPAGSNTWRYVPYLGFSGLDRFSYRIRGPGSPSNSDNLSDVADVVIQVGGTFTADLIRDRFDNVGTGRQVGSPLNGTLTQVGNRTWTANTSAGFGTGILTNLATGGAIGGVTFVPAQQTTATGARLEAWVDSRTGGSGWTGIGYSRSATGGYWTDGQIWMYLRTNGRLQVAADGTRLSLYDSVGAAPGFVAGLNRLTLDYDWDTNSIRAWLNGTPLSLAVPDLDLVAFDPNIQFVGFHGHPEAGFNGTPPLKIDDFHLRLFQQTGRPAAPQNLQATDTLIDKVRLTWSSVAGATAYRVHRSTGTSASSAMLIPQQVTGTLFDDRTAEPNANYTYWVQAVKGTVAGPYSFSDAGKRVRTDQLVREVVANADTTAKQVSPNGNFATATLLEVRNPASGQGLYSFLRFDVSGITGPIQSAHLELRPDTANPVPGVSLFLVDEMFWNETTLNWNNWGQCSVAPFLFKTWELKILGVQSTDRLSFDVTNQVKGNGLVTFGITSDFDQANMKLISKDNGAAPWRPRLRIWYRDAGPSTYVLEPTADARVREAAPTTPFGSNNFLRVHPTGSGTAENSYLKFVIPGSGTVQSATLSLRTQETSIPRIDAYRVGTSSWTEGTLTWNNAPLDVTLHLGPALNLAGNTWIQVPLSTASGGVAAPGTHSIGIVTGSAAPNQDFWSRESMCRPHLEVVLSQ